MPTFTGPTRTTLPHRAEDFPNCSVEDLAMEMSYVPVVTDQVSILIRGMVQTCLLRVEGKSAFLQGPVGKTSLYRCELSFNDWASYLHARWGEFCMDTMATLLAPKKASA